MSAQNSLGSALLAPSKLWRRHEILQRDCPVPRQPGVYAWYFQRTPGKCPPADCLKTGDALLLYVGISPKRPPSNGAPKSRQTLRHRIRYHLRGNAAGSTLRLTLGCLLQDELGISLRRVGSGERFSFADGEQRISDWMDANALVCWVATESPWELEEELISTLSLPLNLDQNRSHAFHVTLSAARRAARMRALELPVWSRPTR
jgi:hypothetical protein